MNIILKKLSLLGFSGISLMLFYSCYSLPSGRTIHQSKSLAVVRGTGLSSYEAKKQAQARAKNIFPSYVSENMKCSQEYSYQLDRLIPMFLLLGVWYEKVEIGMSYWSCVLEINRK